MSMSLARSCLPNTHVADVDPYLIPGTDCLYNRLNITDRAVLAQAEHELSRKRLTFLVAKPLSGDYDLAHLRRFHRRIFHDVYAWAGKLRTVNIGK